MENYKEKYERALETIQEILSSGSDSIMMSRLKLRLQSVFPELKVSEDEKIRKEIIRVFKGELSYTPQENINKYIAWLEKQAGKSTTLPKWKYKKDNTPLLRDSIILNKYGGVAKSPSGAIISDAWVLDYDDLAKLPKEELENQDEQKSTDKVEPKFKVGDWIACSELNTAKIISFDSDRYEVEFIDGSKGLPHIDYVDSHFNLWTIADAKDGDVIFDKSDGTIGIFQSIGHHPDGGSYNDHSYCFLHCRYDDGYFFADFEDGNIADSDDVIPATKEQRDLLFQKMKEARYTFDFEKKELKKIEDEIEIPFGAKDSELQEETYYIPKGFHAEIDDDNVVIKKGEKPAAWSDEDEERIKNTLSVLDVQVCWDGATGKKGNPYQKEIDWLKSIKVRIIWKPSKKQMETLEYYMHTLLATEHKEVLFGLYNDLKKL